MIECPFCGADNDPPFNTITTKYDKPKICWCCKRIVTGVDVQHQCNRKWLSKRKKWFI